MMTANRPECEHSRENGWRSAVRLHEGVRPRDRAVLLRDVRASTSGAGRGRVENSFAAFQEVALGLIEGAGDRRLVRQRGFARATQSPQQICTDGVEQIIA